MLNIFDFCFAPSDLVFSVNRPVCLLDGYSYFMSEKPQKTGDDCDYTIPGEDFRRLLATLFSDRKLPELSDPVPLIQTLTDAYSLHLFRQRGFLIFRLADTAPAEANVSDWARRFKNPFSGELYRLCWFAPAGRLLPYRLYLPCGIAPGERLPLITILHGGGSTPDEIFEVTHHEISWLAQAKRFVVLAPDCCVKNSTYGCPVPPQGLTADSTLFCDTPHTLRGKALSEEALLFVLQTALSTLPVDSDRLYLAGNSMGGMGTFYFASTHPQLFRALAPAGAAPVMSLFDAASLRHTPILFTAGTEDHHGFCHLEAAYRSMKEQGIPITLAAIRGGFHGTAWAENLDEWISFLLEHK